jgi:hypothetical protein
LSLRLNFLAMPLRLFKAHIAGIDCPYCTMSVDFLSDLFYGRGVPLAERQYTNQGFSSDPQVVSALLLSKAKFVLPKFLLLLFCKTRTLQVIFGLGLFFQELLVNYGCEITGKNMLYKIYLLKSGVNYKVLMLSSLPLFYYKISNKIPCLF